MIEKTVTFGPSADRHLQIEIIAVFTGSKYWLG